MVVATGHYSTVASSPLNEMAGLSRLMGHRVQTGTEFFPPIIKKEDP